MEKEEKQGREYNLLTRRLLKAGYTVDNHPDYVKIDVPFARKKSIDNYYGGFTFERRWVYEQTFKTPCGLLCKGLQCLSDMDIGRMCVKLCQDKIREKVKFRYFRELFFAKYHGKEFSVEVQNVRAERREARDLMQDLEDIRNGIQVSHASDLEKRNAECKRERRQKKHEAAVKRLEKKLLETGYGQLQEFSTDKRHADKWLGEERIAQLEEQRKELEREKVEQPVQISLTDLECMEPAKTKYV